MSNDESKNIVKFHKLCNFKDIVYILRFTISVVVVNVELIPVTLLNNFQEIIRGFPTYYLILYFENM
jgi:hypothetical protein